MKNLKILRIKKNISIKDLAKATQIPEKTLVNLENGAAEGISFDYLNRICYVLEVDNLNYLFCSEKFFDKVNK